MAVFTNAYVSNLASANSAFIKELNYAIPIGIQMDCVNLCVFIQCDVVFFIVRSYTHICNLNAVKEESSSLWETI